MGERLTWLIASAGIAYVSCLALALTLGSDQMKTAVIAVDGTTVGAVAGEAGRLAGARTQAEEARVRTQLQAEAQQAGKRLELREGRELAVLQERLRRIERAPGDRRELLSTSRRLGVTAAKKPSYDDVVVEIQEVDTRADMLLANPIRAHQLGSHRGCLETDWPTT